MDHDHEEIWTRITKHAQERTANAEAIVALAQHLVYTLRDAEAAAKELESLLFIRSAEEEEIVRWVGANAKEVFPALLGDLRGQG